MLNERVEDLHVRLFVDRGPVGQVLQEFGNQCQCSTWVWLSCTVNRHECLGGYYCRVDESEHKVSTNQGAHLSFSRVRIFSLSVIIRVLSLVIESVCISNECHMESGRLKT